MNIDYVFLCGVMWCKFAQEDAGQELLRASDSKDADVRSLARAILAKGPASTIEAGRERARALDTQLGYSR
jgi:hypothetical protein